MLIVPLSGKISWKNPPLVTISLIAVNVLVFLIFQSGDDRRFQKAMGFYFESGLGRIELIRFVEHARGTGTLPERLESSDPESWSPGTQEHLYGLMHQDDRFMKDLALGRVIGPEDPEYETWKPLRDRYDERLSKVVFIRWGFRPAFGSMLTALTHMFLHGGLFHLLGNMIFLWLAGCVLEIGCGRLYLAGLYLVGGLMAVGFFALFNMDSITPLVGASGAISALIGAYTATYGRRKIRVFYSLGVYFNYTRLPAVLLLPVWIGNELLMLFFGGESQVAYLAHVGGLMGGALIGLVNLRWLGWVDEEVFGEKVEDRIRSLTEQAQGRMKKVDMDGARPFFRQILELDPENRYAMSSLFQIDKLNPEQIRFHDTAARLLSHLVPRTAERDELHQVYREYVRIARPPRLPVSLLLRICAAFSGGPYIKESEKILAALVRSSPKHAKVPPGLLNLARAYIRQGNAAKGRQCLKVLRRTCPGSPEAQLAGEMLKTLR